jgi:uncharacterized protein (DUF58 family)
VKSKTQNQRPKAVSTSNKSKPNLKSEFLDYVESLTWKDIRNAIVGTLLVFAGIATAILTMYSSRASDPRLTSASAIASLIIVLLLLIFVVPPLARSAGAEIARIDLPVQVTTGGLIFVCITVIVGFAAWNTGNNLLFLVLSVLIASLFVSFIAAQAGLRDLVVSARFPDHIFAGEPATVVVTIRNKKRLFPSFSILVEARGPEDVEELERKSWFYRPKFKKRALGYFTYIPRRAGAEQRVEQTFPKRGHELITGFELSTKFPFGFFRHRRRLPARNVDIVIFPKTELISDQLHLLPMNAGRLISTRRGAGHDLLSLRDYQPQDDLRHIDWKATARARRLIVREFTTEDEKRVNIRLDTRLIKEIEETKASINKNKTPREFLERFFGDSSTPNRVSPKKRKETQDKSVDKQIEENFERGVTQAASLVQHFIDERAEVRLILGQESGHYGVGKEHLYDCLKRLALVKAEHDTKEKKDSKQQDVNIALADDSFSILLTTAKPGTIPAHIWRTSHVIFL